MSHITCKVDCCNHSNNVVQQVDTQGKAALVLHDKYILSCDITLSFILGQGIL